MNTLVRAFAFALVLTGAAASAFHSVAPTSDSMLNARASAIPVPVCPPTGTETCGAH